MKKAYKYLLSFVICFVCCLLLFGVDAQAGVEDYEYPHYVGVATATVNVREGPGVSYDQVTDDSGKNIQLNTGDEVEIFEEKKADDGKIWYHIAFTQKGKDYLGFSTSSYVAIDKDRVITPAPTPTPEPTPEIIPEIVPEVVPENLQDVEISDSEIDKSLENVTAEEEDSAGGFWNAFWILVIIVIILGCAAFVLYYLRNKNIDKPSTPERRIDRFKENMKAPSNQTAGRKQPQIKKSPTVSRAPEEVKREVYYKKPSTPEKNDNYVEVSHDDLAAESESELSLKEKIDRLQDHDIVNHIVYGEGEVSDNSDVHLLEVKFGNDTRYLKKDQLVKNHELRVYDDEDQNLARRRRRRNNTINRNY